MKKKCSTCKEIKDITEFNRKAITKDGYNFQCKQCINIYAYNKKRTIDGLINVIYGHQKRNSKQRGMDFPEYSNTELKLWCKKQIVFYVLYDQWKESDYKKEFTPSIDRINDYKGYLFNNIQLMTWKENNTKGHTDRRNGVNNKKNISVVQLNINGNFIKEYYSMNNASRVTQIAVSDIHRVCNEKRYTAGGFKWLYKEDYERRIV